MHVYIYTYMCVFYIFIQAGKSVFVRRMIKERVGLFTVKPTHVVYCYNIMEDELLLLQNEDSNIILHKGAPTREQFDD
jgi:hypothetical protein